MGIFNSIKDKFSSVSKEDRLKVQGISLGENIDTFEAQLQARGWRKENDLPASMKLLAKQYTGTFNNCKADLIISYNIVLRNIEFVGINYERTTLEEATRQNNENLRKVIEAYGVQPKKYPDGYMFELKHGRISCNVVPDGYGKYATALVYANVLNNPKYIQGSYSEF